MMLSIENLENRIDSALNVYVTSVSQSMTAYAVTLAVVINTIYFFKFGYATARGDAQDPMNKLFKDFFMMAIVAGIAFSFGNYQHYVIDGMRAIQSDLTSVVSVRSGNARSIGQLLDYLFYGCLVPPGESECIAFNAVLSKLALKNANTFGIPDFTYTVGSFLLGCAELVILLCCILPWLLSKVALAIMLAIGPVFVMTSMWPATRKYFENWLSAALGNVFTMVLVAAITSITPTIFRQFVEDSFNGLLNADVDIIGRMLALLLVAAVLGIMALLSSQKGAHLAGGGVSLDGRGFGGMVVQAGMNRLLMGKNSADNKKDKTNGQEKNAVTPPSAAYKASGSVGRVAGHGVKNILDALDRRGK